MEPEVMRVLQRIEKEDAHDRAERERGVFQERHDRMLALSPDTGQLAHMLVQAARARNIIEIGVSYGYSTVWLAHAARLTGGGLKALEINPRSIERAGRNLAEAGLTGMVDFVVGDARETVFVPIGRDLEVSVRSLRATA